MPANVITLTTDFGITDHYVAQMKAVLLSRAPSAHIVDVTHSVPRHSILHASFTLERIVTTFPAGSIHVVVVDPGVGSARRLLLTELRQQLILCPDNGLITWPHRLHPGARFHELTYQPNTTPSHTFHGRDILTPAAAALATGTPLASLSRPLDKPILLPIHPATEPAGQIIHIDHFGNCTTNIPAQIVPPTTRTVLAASHAVPFHRTYADVPPGLPLALIGSSHLLEIAVNEGSAADLLHLEEGSPITLPPSTN